MKIPIPWPQDRLDALGIEEVLLGTADAMVVNMKPGLTTCRSYVIPLTIFLAAMQGAPWLHQTCPIKDAP